MEGDNPVHALESIIYDLLSTSRVAWDCSSKWVARPAGLLTRFLVPFTGCRERTARLL